MTPGKYGEKDSKKYGEKDSKKYGEKDSKKYGEKDSRNIRKKKNIQEPEFQNISILEDIKDFRYQRL